MDREIDFYKIVRNRSNENSVAFELLYQNELYGNCIGLLRLELESYMKCIYLAQVDYATKMHLVDQFFEDKQWYIMNKHGKNVKVTDRKILDTIKSYGWEENVYAFGCSFIHLSSKCGYLEKDIFQSLCEDERNEIIKHINNYHGANLTKESTQEEIFEFLPSVFQKIRGNLLCHIEDRINKLEEIEKIEIELNKE